MRCMRCRCIRHQKGLFVKEKKRGWCGGKRVGRELEMNEWNKDKRRTVGGECGRGR